MDIPPWLFSAATNGTSSDTFSPPAYLPITLAFVSTVGAGVTTFGDGILFLLLWAIAGVAGAFPADAKDALPKAVMYVTLLPLTSLPALLWAARKELRDSLGYATVLSASSAMIIPFGALLLVKGDTAALKISVGVFFAVFAVWKMTESVYDWARARARKRSGGPVAVAAAEPKGDSQHALIPEKLPAKLPAGKPKAEVDVSALGANGSPDSVDDPQAVATYQTLTSPIAPGDPERTKDEEIIFAQPPERQPASSCCTRPSKTCVRNILAEWFPPISDRFSPSQSALILFLTGFVSGILSGMVGTSGPPQMVAFTMLRMDKHFIRGVKVLATTVGNAIRMLSFAIVGTHLFQASEWPVYLGVSIASIVGTAVGSKLRDYLDTEAILRCLYMILFLSTSTLFDVTASVPAAIAYSMVGFAFGLLLIFIFCWPHLVAAGRAKLVSLFRSCCPGCCREAVALQPADGTAKKRTEKTPLLAVCSHA